MSMTIRSNSIEDSLLLKEQFLQIGSNRILLLKGQQTHKGVFKDSTFNPNLSTNADEINELKAPVSNKTLTQELKNIIIPYITLASVCSA